MILRLKKARIPKLLYIILEPDTFYVVEVSAVNAEGTGNYSPGLETATKACIWDRDRQQVIFTYF